MKTLARIIAALSICLSSPAWADGTINTLTAGSALSGTELIPMFQGSNPAVSTSPNAIKTFVNSVILGSNNTWTGTNSFAGATFSSSITATGLSAGTQVSCIGLDASNHFVLSAAACGAGGGSGTVNSGTAGQLGYYAGTGTAISGLTVGNTLKITGSTIDLAAAVVAGSTQTITTTQWAQGNTFQVTLVGQTLTLPASSGLAVNGGIIIQTVGQSVTLAPNAADRINGGTLGASVTLASGLTAFVTTDAAGNIYAQPTSLGGSATCSGDINAACSQVTNLSNVVNGSLGTSGIANSAVTLAKIANAAASSKLIGSGATGSGAPYAEITLGTNLSMSGTTLNATGGGGSGSLVKIGAATAANSTCLSWGLAVSGCVNGSTADLSGLGYNTFQIDCDSLKPGTASGYLYVHVAEGSPTPTVKVTNYGSVLDFRNLPGTTVGTFSGGTTASSNVGMITGNGVGTAATASLHGVLNLSTSQIPRSYLWRGNFPGDGTTLANIYYMHGIGSYVGDQSAITAITIDLYSAVNGTQETGASALVSGSCTLYGITP